MNRRGSIPVTALFFMAILLVVITWMIFLSSDTNISGISQNVSMGLSEIEFNQQYIISEAQLIANQTIASGVSDAQLKSKFMEIAATHSLGISQEGNFFAKIRNGDFSFIHQGNVYTLQINGVNIEAQDSSQNPVLQIKRHFDINMGFDSKGQWLT